jgi:hypothetical protein
VEFCKDAGIIDGYEDGTFHPYRTLTTDQWLKMLLTAIGFDANKFGLTGKDWAVNTAEVALRYDLITADEYKLDFDREVAILYAYKALQFQFDGNDPLATSVFQLTSKVTYDVFAAPTAEVFSSKGKEIASIAITPDGVYDNTVYEVPNGAIVYVDGVKTSLTKIDIKSAEISYYKANAYSDKSKAAVIVKNTYVAKLDDSDSTVTAVLTALNKENSAIQKGAIVTYNKGNKSILSNLSSTVVDPVYKNGTILTATAGTITARNVEGKWVNVGDNETQVYFNANALPTDKNEVSELGTNIKYNLYYDKFGNIAYVGEYKDAPAPKTLIFLIAAYAKADKDYSDISDPKMVETTQAKYIDLTTGEIKTTEFASLDGNAVSTLTNGKLDSYYASGAIDQFYYAVENENGIALERYYTFHAANVVKEDAHVILSNLTDKDNDTYADGVNTYTADSKTNLTVIDYTGALETKSISKVTGIANFETRTYDYPKTYATVVDYETTNVPSDIYVITPAAEPEATYVYGMYVGEDTDYAVKGQGYKFVLSDGTTATYYYDMKDPDDAKTNPSDGWDGKALTKGNVYKLTMQNGSFTNAYELSATATGTIVKTDVTYIAIKDLESVYYYSNDFGFKTLDATGKAVDPVLVGAKDSAGRDKTPTTVQVYTDTEGVPGEVVFMTAK